MQMKINKYPCGDFYLTAYLLASGMKLLGTEKLNPHKTLFVLEDISGRESLVQNFFAGRASVNPLAYKDCIQNLKAMLHNSY